MESVSIAAVERAVFAFRLRLVRPLPLRGGVTLTEREGLLVRVGDETGRVGWGEASPLPTFSRETLADVQADLLHWASTGDVPTTPSARFALEASLRHLPEEIGHATIQLNGLVVAGDGAADQAQALVDAGYRAVKLKVGGGALEEDVARVRAVHAALSGRATLRLDANRQWTWDHAVAFVDAVRGCHVEYIEEPLTDPSQLADFAKASGLPVALDESVLEMAPAQLDAHAYAKVIVLKPTFGGGWAWAEAWHKAAAALGIKVVLSAAFESGVGLQHLVAMASQFAGDAVPVGLDTYRWLASDVLNPGLNFAQPSVVVAHVLRHTPIDDAQLKRLA
ncbi:MAG: o-succinylbenzoate synthase [Rhodothermales bacterium]